jgi:phage terminase small subunit
MVMGRNAQPISILQANGRKHLTKAEIEQRQETEIKLGSNKLICPSYIKDDVNAFKKWKEITKIYKDVDFVSTGDTGLLARYCLTHSEYLNLCDTRNHIVSLQADWTEYEGLFPQEFQENIEKLLTTNTELQLESAINKKMDMLIKMEDRLFLNPLAKVKNVPKTEPQKEDPVKDRFGNI